jgi:hypothetical protein
MSESVGSKLSPSSTFGKGDSTRNLFNIIPPLTSVTSMGSVDAVAAAAITAASAAIPDEEHPTRLLCSWGKGEIHSSFVLLDYVVEAPHVGDITSQLDSVDLMPLYRLSQFGQARSTFA